MSSSAAAAMAALTQPGRHRLEAAALDEYYSIQSYKIEQSVLISKYRRMKSFSHDALRQMDKLPSFFLHYCPPESCLRFSDMMNFSGLLLARGDRERKM